MGWWKRDEPSISLSSGGDLGDAREFVHADPRLWEGVACSARKVVRSSCRTEEAEGGRFIRKCERIEETLRDCVGRSVEVVESKTERSEEDVTDEVKRGVPSFGFPTSSSEPFTFPGISSDFLQEAEEMVDGFFQSFGFPSNHGGEPAPFGGQKQEDRGLDKDAPDQPIESSIYSEFSGKIRDV
ncbi:fra a 1-associated protein-like [Typha angustifolia]|uniref:fra a 1-associated protein-like n=1 Tax=Typha angustifolia TaxID=59011 RepID=UPI003C2ED96E